MAQQLETADHADQKSRTPTRRHASFSEHYFARLDQAMPADAWINISDAIAQLNRAQRSYLPTHKKGGTISYETICREAPDVATLYQSRELQGLISGIVECQIFPTPSHDQNSCSILMYERPGDHIDWHYDYNFYRGRHFTVLIPVVNTGGQRDGSSSAKLMARINGIDQHVPTPPNSLITFEGAKLLHKVTPIANGERRVILSMTYCADPTNTRLQGAARRIKDISFFGLRALWT